MDKMAANVKGFLELLRNNGNLRKLGTNSGNNHKLIHRWLSFSPGFSHEMVEATLRYFGVVGKNSHVFDPFIGSGTTGVVGKYIGVNVYGNETHPFLYRIAKAKTDLRGRPESLRQVGDSILDRARTKWSKTNLSEEIQVLRKCYSEDNLKKLVTLREMYYSTNISNTYKPYIFLAISALLVRCASVSINIPYISWRHSRIPEEPFKLFEKTLSIIKQDLEKIRKLNNTIDVKIYLQDSRKRNNKIKDTSIDLIFTSPPYLNNLDYGESFKVFTYFWQFARNWGEITQKIRKKAITSSTTHYTRAECISKAPAEMLGAEMIDAAPKTAKEIISKIDQMKLVKKKKSFDILTALYFKDMFQAIKEMHRVLKDGGLAFFIIGDSAPHGIYTPTDVFLGMIAVELGFSKYTLETLRQRGCKWVGLRYRHKIRLRENLLVLEK